MNITENTTDENTTLDKTTIDNLIKLYEYNNIPNIIIHGPNLTGKKLLLKYFLKLVYKNNDDIKKYVLCINCSHGKGNIKFIRENLKYFANSIIDNKKNHIFKSIVLLNADKLTIDAQSALRRCIELYNHSTRFFIVVDDKYKILKPILSRFSDIYCNNKKTEYLCNNNNSNTDFTNKRLYYLSRYISIYKNNKESINKPIQIIDLTNKLYNNGFSGNLLILYIKNKFPENYEKYQFLQFIDIYKKDLRDEKITIMFCLNYIFFRNNIDFKNIIFI